MKIQSALAVACVAAVLHGKTITVSVDGNGDFKTISAAAEVAGPGDVVLVSPGVYREEIRVAVGGKAKAPVVFRSATEKAAVIKGSEVWTNPWNPLAGSEGCFESEIDAGYFAGRSNPYLTTISIHGSDKSRTARPVEAADGEATFAPRTLGQMFVDGKQYSETTSLASLRRSAGTWMVSYDGSRIWLHPCRKDVPVGRHLVEWSVRNRVFHAKRRGLEHVVLDGFTLEHCANQGPFPQIGLVDTRSGMNWTIENCTVRHAKTIGIAIGGETWEVDKLVDVPEEDRKIKLADGNIVRNCMISDCGVSGISGWHPGTSFIYNNILERNNRGGYGWPEEYWYEVAAIKLHISKCVIAGNVIRDNDSHGIWLDTGFKNSRITGNLIVNNRYSGIFLESAFGTSLVDNNIIGLSRPWCSYWPGDGIYSHNGSCVTVAHNLIFGCAGAGVRFRTIWGKLGDGRGYETSTNRFVGNIFCLNSSGGLVIACTNDTSRGVVSDYNVYLENSHIAKRHPMYPFRFANYNIGKESWTGLYARVAAAAGTNAMPYEAWRGLANPATMDQWRTVQGMDMHSHAEAAKLFEFSVEEKSLAWSFEQDVCSMTLPALAGIDRDYFGNPYPKSAEMVRPGPFQDASLFNTNGVQFSVAPYERSRPPAAWRYCPATEQSVMLAAEAKTIYLDEFPLDAMSCGLRLRPCANRSVLGGDLRMGTSSNRFVRGVGTHVESVMIFESDGRTRSFDAIVGIDWAANEYPKRWDTGKNWGGAIFRVYADGKIVAETDVVKPQDMPRKLHADLFGAHLIVIEATDCGDLAGYRFGHADWAEAFFTVDDGAILRPHSDKGLSRQFGRLTPPESDAPSINGPALFGVRPGHEFVYRLPVSGKRPMTISVGRLPDGVMFDAAVGVLTGRIVEAGTSHMRVVASNAWGYAERDFALKVGSDICLTPPMGWNSWNIHNANVTDSAIRSAARGMVESGLADHGWCYVNIDDGWAVKLSPEAKVRRDNGKIIPNEKFPDMRSLAGYVHSLGLKIGIYSSPGAETCGGYAGSLGYERRDAATYAEWGFDYLKYDWCSYGKVFAAETKGRANTVEDYARPYRLMSEALQAQNRDIIHAFCQYGMGDVQSWGRAAGAQVWRSHGDLKDSWGALVKSIDSYGEMAWKYAGPGFWCDPDMLVVGYLDTDKGLHWSDLTHNEQYTHMTLWCMLNAPLLLGCDLNRLDDFTKGLLTNDDVLSVNQDSLGKSARRVIRRDDMDVWLRPIVGQAYVVAIVNRFPYTRDISLDFASVDLPRKAWVKDLWRRMCLGIKEDSVTFSIPGHACMMIKVVEECPGCESRKL